MCQLFHIFKWLTSIQTREKLLRLAQLRFLENYIFSKPCNRKWRILLKPSRVATFSNKCNPFKFVLPTLWWKATQYWIALNDLFTNLILLHKIYVHMWKEENKKKCVTSKVVTQNKKTFINFPFNARIFKLVLLPKTATSTFYFFDRWFVIHAPQVTQFDILAQPSIFFSFPFILLLLHIFYSNFLTHIVIYFPKWTPY